jgi:hypothetical protein
MLRKRSRHASIMASTDHTTDTTVDRTDRSTNEESATQWASVIDTIIMTATKRPLRKSLLLKVSSLFALLSVASALEDSEDIRRRLGDRQREQDIRIRERFLVEEDCIHVIASFVQGTGNVDPVFGSSDFTRTNAKAMCVSESLYQSLINSPEVLFVELDAPVTTAQYTYSNGEAIPWGADRVLQSVWDEIPLPDEGGEIALCVVDSGLLVDHDDIVSISHTEVCT